MTRKGVPFGTKLHDEDLAPVKRTLRKIKNHVCLKCGADRLTFDEARKHPRLRHSMNAHNVGVARWNERSCPECGEDFADTDAETRLVWAIDEETKKFIVDENGQRRRELQDVVVRRPWAGSRIAAHKLAHLRGIEPSKEGRRRR